MNDEALRRLIARLRQDLVKLPEELRRHGGWDRLDPEDRNFDSDEAEKAEYFAKRSIEDAVHLVGALLLSDPMLVDLHSAFKAGLPGNLLQYKWGRDEHGEEYFHFPAQNAVERFFDLGVASLGGMISAERLEVADSICRGLGGAIAYFVKEGWMQPPDKETPVKHLGIQLLKSAFPDTQSDGRVRFRLADGTDRIPDAAIPSLRLCVEFKYADSEAELSKRVDEIAADMSAYGDARYDLFRAVVFAPYEHASQESLQKLMDERTGKLGPEHHWKAFLVTAAGGRRRGKTEMV